MKVLIFVSLLAFACSTDWRLFKKEHVSLNGLDLRGVKIIGGDVVKPHSYPSQVGILINGKSFCGGTLLSENYVLTAAHCGAVISEAEIILGAHNITAEEPTQVRINVGNVTVHEEYDPRTFQNDVALLKLENPVTLTDVIKPVTLASRSDENTTYYAETVIAVGWGLDGDVPGYPSNNDLSPLLKSVNVTILDVYSCGNYYNNDNTEYVTKLNLCTSGHKNKGTCNGDSGGPLFHDGVQIGIVSSGATLCEMCYPSIYTNVAKFLSWIQDNSDVCIGPDCHKPDNGSSSVHLSSILVLLLTIIYIFKLQQEKN